MVVGIENPQNVGVSGAVCPLPALAADWQISYRREVFELAPCQALGPVEGQAARQVVTLPDGARTFLSVESGFNWSDTCGKLQVRMSFPFTGGT